jgi:hypothetical protein
MKIWIDKHGGMHYHKADCTMIKDKNPPMFPYEEIEHLVRRIQQPYCKEYAKIKIDDRYYYPCPFCFGHPERHHK